MKEQLDAIKKLLFDSCRATADYAVDLLLKKPELLAGFETLAFSDNYPFDMRSSNVIEKADEIKHGFAADMIPRIVQHLTLFKSDGPRRQFLRMLARYVHEIDEDYTGILYDACFEFACDPAQPVAVRHNALLVIGKLCVRYPDLKNEIYSALELRSNDEHGPFGAWLKAFLVADHGNVAKK
ncbi:MAG: hypothetical protein A2W93_04960 [Bacteroidetes bacterium GWF2_43_63]|nr:MAG: hypothetical protein A2W94_12190 [Bacteroidetes bacterium GWE2_42_42]OFY56229.1 MAG: hypothetical protein A2W93_04960 [Bacteroidetes bacterium GWF2_43_63]HBG71901.1 hypothetical protein [Bacteroidales bacterium]HCB61802.1 hypothetical protein [Bacteroidales bacterium]HCY23824.1 hypothetical protein [Bacteroidales bacterium]